MRNGQQGTTLLEVVLGMLVLALGLFAAAALQVKALQATASARQHSQATYLAQSLLEQARAGGSVGALAEWQAQIRLTLGAQAEGRVRGAGPLLEVVVDWPDARDPQHQGVSLQGWP
nr:hypothetical protein [uncultured Pseudomonas sp.]